MPVHVTALFIVVRNAIFKLVTFVQITVSFTQTVHEFEFVETLLTLLSLLSHAIASDYSEEWENSDEERKEVIKGSRSILYRTLPLSGWNFKFSNLLYPLR